MPKNKCLIILSEKSSGSSACQSLLARFAEIRHVAKTRHFENETLYWTKAASILGRPQLKMVNSEVPIEREQAKADLLAMLRDNLDDFEPPNEDEELAMEGWRALCRKYSPIFLEKSPHHLCQWSALELIIQCMRQLDEVDFLLIGLIRNPLDTIYSQYSRWKSPYEKVQSQWLVAYQNLLKLKDIVGSRLVIIRYEDMVSSLQCLEPVFEFCGVTVNNADRTYLHSKSISKWKKDVLFDFSLSSEAIELARMYGYKQSELVNRMHQLSPVSRNLLRVTYMSTMLVKRITRSLVKKINRLR